MRVLIFKPLAGRLFRRECETALNFYTSECEVTMTGEQGIHTAEKSGRTFIDTVEGNILRLTTKWNLRNTGIMKKIGCEGNAGEYTSA